MSQLFSLFSNPNMRVIRSIFLMIVFIAILTITKSDPQKNISLKDNSTTNSKQNKNKEIRNLTTTPKPEIKTPKTAESMKEKYNQWKVKYFLKLNNNSD